ncbi:hypothetical protein GGI07_000501 [Coemansia sp. Benny D115]|nr:hypothetical protein GGI07_000501 [Coemansia sp. Benny D115]
MSAPQQQQPTTNGTSPEPRKVPTQEVGWIFASEYYTIMNSDPSRLHYFYGKKSTSIHGNEGDVVKQANGQQEIRALIEEDEFKGRKVLVTNVDTLPAIDGSIVIQAIGLIESKDGLSEQHFAQTFVLGEQQGGYYLHNDILRYLKDHNGSSEAAVPATTEPAAEVPAEKDEKISSEKEAAPKEEAAPAVVPVAVASEVVAEVVAPVAEVKEAVLETVADSIVAVPAAAAAATASDAAPAAKSEPKAKSTKEKPSPAAAPAPAAPKPAEKPAPAKPTTWAGLAADSSKKWNNNTIAKVEGTVTPAASAVTASPSEQPARSGTPGAAPRESRRKNEALSVFLKNIPQGTTITAIKNGCKAFGPVAFVEYGANKVNGIVEFATEEGKRAALSAGKTTINNATVFIEERRFRQSSGSGRRDNTAGKPARQNEFETVGAQRGSRSRAPTATGNHPGANRARGAKQ